VERQILDQALAQVHDNRWDDDSNRALVLCAQGWHPGVIGIVASRIVDRFSRPTIMVALTDSHGQGSGRSIPGFHLAHALDACREHLIAYGGHEMAAGLKVELTKVEEFRRAFCQYAASAVTLEMLSPQLNLECLSELSQISQAVVRDLKRLGPFGHGNRRPLLCLENLSVCAPPRRVGKSGDHLQLLVKQNNRSIKCIAFNSAGLIDRLAPGASLDLAVEPCVNEFNGRSSVELDIKDFRFR